MLHVGPYTKRLRKTRRELERHFFEPCVLEKYRNDPHYHLRETGLGTVEDSGVELSGLQQYVWGHKADGSACLMAFLVHLCSLSAKDQDHWQLNEIRNPRTVGATVDKRYLKPILHGEFRDTISIYEAVYVYLQEIEELFHPDVLFPNLPDEHPLFLVPLAYNSKKAMVQFAQDLSTLLQFNMKVLAKRIVADDLREEVKACLEREKRRDLLELYFTRQHRILPAHFKDTLDALRELNELRKLGAHKLTAPVRDKDYLKLQVDLVDRLQSGLGSMMLAFAETEKGSEGVLSKTVLNYRVVVY